MSCGATAARPTDPAEPAKARATSSREPTQPGALERSAAPSTARRMQLDRCLQVLRLAGRPGGRVTASTAGLLGDWGMPV
jgi:hypothetical protein